MLMPWIKGNGQRGFKDEDLQKIVKRERCSRELLQRMDIMK
jgi:hypothetical protein